MDKCEECGCLEIDGYEYHLAKCSQLKIHEEEESRTYIKKVDYEEISHDELAYAKNALKRYNSIVNELTEFLKKVCIDEVYECRYDCMYMLG